MMPMQVLTVPGLEPLMATHLTPIVGFPFSWAPEPAAAAKLQKATCVSLSGTVSLVTSPGVLVRVSLAGLAHAWSHQRPALACAAPDYYTAL